jgi:multidrug efflux system outer membrane protein
MLLKDSPTGGKKANMIRKPLLSFIIVCIMTGCMVGPNYQRADIDTPSAWRFDEKEAKDVVNTPWWEQFNDPVLDELITVALRENKDLMIASSRVEEYMGRLGATRAGLFPQVDAAAEGGRERVTESGATPIPPGISNTSNFYQVQLNGSWEIDIWGRLRRATEAARAELLSTEEGRRAVVLTLVTSVASSYINLRSLDRQLEISKRTAESRKESLRIFHLRFEGGVISELELNQVKSQYQDALAAIPEAEKAIAQQENALSLLLGKNPGPIPRGKEIDELALPAVPAGLPSDLLEQRPDILQAEQDLIAANAQIGVARAAYFPSISLTGFFGFASVDLSDLFKGPSKVWNFTAPITAPIFTGGALAGQVRATEALQQQALVRYQQVIQNAFRDVEDALADQSRTREQLDILSRLVESLKDYARIARLRYDNGYTSYIEVLDAERSLFDAELAYTQTQGLLFRALINMYKAMGGGWIVEADRIHSEK